MVGIVSRGPPHAIRTTAATHQHPLVVGLRQDARAYHRATAELSISHDHVLAAVGVGEAFHVVRASAPAALFAVRMAADSVTAVYADTTAWIIICAVTMHEARKHTHTAEIFVVRGGRDIL